MDNLQYIHEQLCYAEDQRELADDMYSMQAWDQRIDALQCAYNFIAEQCVSKEARESVPHYYEDADDYMEYTSSEVI